MDQNNGLSELGRALAELDEAGVETLVQKGLDQKIPPEQIISELSAGITEVGERFRREEYFLSELIYSGEIFKNTMASKKETSQYPSFILVCNGLGCSRHFVN